MEDFWTQCWLETRMAGKQDDVFLRGYFYTVRSESAGTELSITISLFFWPKRQTSTSSFYIKARSQQFIILRDAISVRACWRKIYKNHCMRYLQLNYSFIQQICKSICSMLRIMDNLTYCNAERWIDAATLEMCCLTGVAKVTKAIIITNWQVSHSQRWRR